MIYRLCAVRIFATDWHETSRFYRDTLALPEKFSDPDSGWAEFDVGGPSLAIERLDSNDPEREALIGRFLGISLEVDDIEQAYKDLTDRDVLFLGPPERQPWGGILAHLRDPESNVLTLLGH